MDVERSIAAGNKVNEALTTLMRRRNVSTTARLTVHNVMLVPTLLYGSETWVLQKQKNERKMNAVEMRSLRRMCGVSLADRICNQEIHRMAGTSEDVTVRMKKNVLSWFGHVERMRDGRIAKKIYDGKVSGKRDRGRPRLTFENTVRRRKRYVETVAFGALFSLTTWLRIKREASSSSSSSSSIIIIYQL